MDSQQIITFVILAIAIIMLLSDRIRPDLVAIMMIIVLGVTQVLTPQETFSGFSRSAVITLMGIFILTEGLQRTGVNDLIGQFLLRFGGSSESRLIIIIMLVGAGLSLFMNNIAAASILLPAVSGVARRAQVNPAKLLIPLAFSTILGGMATLLTTTNILVSSLLRDQGLAGFGLLDFLPVGLPVVICGIVYMVLVGRRLLPKQLPAQYLDATQRNGKNLADIYRLEERLLKLQLKEQSELVGLTIKQSKLREEYNLNLVAIQRAGKLHTPQPLLKLAAKDRLIVAARPDELSQEKLGQDFGMLPLEVIQETDLESAEVVLIEAVLAPRSSLIGQTLKTVLFREKYNMNVLAVWRTGKPIRTHLTDLALQFGDALLLQGQRRQLPILRLDPDLIVLTGEKEPVTPEPRKAGLALAIMIMTLAISAWGIFSIGEVMLGGAILMILSGILTMDQAYQAIEWKSIFVLAGMLPMGIALSKTGAAALLAENLFRAIAPVPALVLLAILFILATLLTQTMSGSAVAAIMIPIAIQLANRSGTNPRAIAMGVALATSMAFMTPLGHPVNILIMGPGGYRFRDYLRVGLPLTIILLVVILLTLPIFWPLTG